MISSLQAKLSTTVSTRQEHICSVRTNLTFIFINIFGKVKGIPELLSNIFFIWIYLLVLADNITRDEP